jgi:autotransporter-associated beta strand protein
MNKRLKNFAASLLAVLAVMAPNELYSATVTWTGGGSTANWRQAAHWVGALPGAVPLIGDDLVFAGSTRTIANNNDNITRLPYIQSITFDSTAAAFTLGGGYALGIRGSIVNNSSSTQTFDTLGIELQSSNVNINTAAGNIIFNSGAAISGANSLTKTGSANLTLLGNKTYTGATTVSAGTLTIGSTGSVSGSSLLDVASNATLNVSAVTGGFVVGSSQTLRGSGTVVGNTTVNGALQPGDSPGLLSFNNNLTLGNTAVTTMEINNTGTRGMVYDAINVGGLLTYDGSLRLTLGTTFDVGSYSFDLFDFGSQTGSFDSVTLVGSYYSGSLGKDVGLSTNWGLTSGDNTWTFDQSTGVLGLSVIPEPSPLALSGLGLLALAVSALRKRKQP